MTDAQPQSWSEFGPQAVALGVDASAVAVMRFARLLGGGPPAFREARALIADQVESAAHVHAAVLTGALGHSPVVVTRALLQHWSSKTRANRRRLEAFSRKPKS